VYIRGLPVVAFIVVVWGESLGTRLLRNTKRVKLIFHILTKVIGAPQVCCLGEANMKHFDQLRLSVRSKCL